MPHGAHSAPAVPHPDPASARDCPFRLGWGTRITARGHQVCSACQHPAPPPVPGAEAPVPADLRRSGPPAA